MIISASRYTDIPALYPDWLIERLHEGVVYVRNPLRPNEVSEIPLSPHAVDCLVLWTKNAAPLLPRLAELDPYPYYFQYTITGYGPEIEPNLPDKDTAIIPAFQNLSRRIGAYRVIWRYDPIFFSNEYTPDWHLNKFRELAGKLRGYTEKCVISFLDVFTTTSYNLRDLCIEELSPHDLGEFAGRLARIAAENGMVMATCAEEVDLKGSGIEHNACIDKELIERIIGTKLKVKQDNDQRENCRCVESIDIGRTNTCTHGCVYCYANYTSDLIGVRNAKYDPRSPILCDSIAPSDTILRRDVWSGTDGQFAISFG